MRERVEGAAVSVDDIVAFLEHVSMDAAACASVEESFRAFYPSKVMAIKRTANTATAAKFKTAIVAPMGVPTVGSHKGRTWRPLNVLGTTLEGWNAMKTSSCSTVTSADQDKRVLQLIMDYVQCGLLANKYGLAESWAKPEADGSSSSGGGGSSKMMRRSSSGGGSGASSLFAAAPFASPSSAMLPTAMSLDDASPVQQREKDLPDTPAVFTERPMSMPVAAIVEFMCDDTTIKSLRERGGSGLNLEGLGGLARPMIDVKFHGISVKSPLNQNRVSTVELGALARRLDTHHNRAATYEASLLLTNVKLARFEAEAHLKQAQDLYGTATSLAPPADMPLFEYYRVSEPLRRVLDPAVPADGSDAPFDFKSARFPARKQGFAVQHNMDHKAAAILRAIMYETHVSQSQFTLQWSYWHLFFTGKPATEDDLRSIWTLRMRFQQLDEKDRMVVVGWLTELTVTHPEARFAYMSDATHYASGERLIRQFTYPHIPKQSSQAAAAAAAAAPVAPAGEAKEEDPSSEEEEEEDGPCDMHADGAVRTPRTHFLSIGETASKSATDTAAACLMSIRTIIGDFAVSRLIGGTVDHAALSEIRKVREAAIAAGVSPVAAVVVALGDDFHKTGLVMKWLTKGSFGSDHKIGSFHHIQVMHSFWYLIDHDSANLMAWITDWLGYDEIKRPKQPQPQRWETTGACADHLFDMKRMESAKHPGKFLIPDGFMLLAEKFTESSYQHDLCCDISLQSCDERIIAALTMESEVLDVYWAPTNRFNRQKSSLGYDVGFRGRDMPPEVMRRRRFWADAAADPASSFPRTWAAIQAIGQSGITMPAAPDGSHGALDTPAVQEMYERKFKSGIASASKEFDKLYACWDDAPLLFWWLNTPGYAPAAVRAILKATHEADSSMLPGGLLPAMPAIPAGTADGHFSRVLRSDDKKSLLVSWVKELGLFNNKERIYELVRMAQSTVTLTDTDDDTLEFVHKYPLLDDWLFFSLDVLPTINLICELSFSQIKQFRNANETQMTTDMKMRCANKITTRPSLRSCRVLTTNQLPLRYHQNMVHIFREQRKELGMSEEQLLAVKRGEAYAQPNDTHPKVIRAAEQLNGLIETYSDDAMAEVASVDAKKKVVMRDIKSASAKAFVEKTNKPEATKVSLSERDWEQKKAALRARSTTSDQSQLKSEAETTEDRTTAELRRIGHWTDVAAPGLRREIEGALPLLYRWLQRGRALAESAGWKQAVTSANTKVKKFIKSWTLKGATAANLKVLAKGFAIHVHSLVASFLDNARERLELGRLFCFVRPLTSSAKAIASGIANDRRLLEWPSSWHQPRAPPPPHSFKPQPNGQTAAVAAALPPPPADTQQQPAPTPPAQAEPKEGARRSKRTRNAPRR